jgi:FkbM family methyltransferase
MTSQPPPRIWGAPIRALDRFIAWQVQQASLVELRGHHVLSAGLGEGSLVVDAGANRGEFSDAASRRFGCSVLSLEPVPSLFSAIPGGRGRIKIQRALAAIDGRRVLHLSANPEGHSLDPRLASLEGGTGTVEVEACTLSTLLAEAGQPAPDLLKLDIEGEEIAVLEAMPADLVESIGQITVEFHDFLESSVSAEKVRSVIGRLRSLGFFPLVLSWPWGHHADTLFINRRRHRLPLGTRLHLWGLRLLTLPLRRALERVRRRFPRPVATG